MSHQVGTLLDSQLNDPNIKSKVGPFDPKHFLPKHFINFKRLISQTYDIVV